VDDLTDRREHLRLASSRPLSLISGGHAPDRDGSHPSDGTPRPAFTSIAVRVAGDRVEATAILALHGHILTGGAIGDAADRSSIVATATLDALAPLLEFDASVDSALIVDATGHDVALVILRTGDDDTGSDLLVGSALVRGDIEDALARSVLSALNRRLGH